MTAARHTERAFHAAILADPSDATAKIIYADWLDEAGETNLAGAFRWAAATDKFPEHMETGVLVNVRWSRWSHWYWQNQADATQSEVKRWPATERQATVPRPVFCLLKKAKRKRNIERERNSARYRTWLDAMKDLGHALAAGRAIFDRGR